MTCRGPAGWYWLAGRRSPTENWDAFEAPGGEPLLSAPSTSDWREVHRSLSSLTIELDASVREEMDIRPTLAHVWKRADGHLVLLDFPWPGLAASDANQNLGPVELLAAVSRQLVAPGMEPAAPLSGTTLLNRLSSGAPPALADVKAELLHLASIPSRPSRIRRAPADGDGGDAGGRTDPGRHRDASQLRAVPSGRETFPDVDDVDH